MPDSSEYYIKQGLTSISKAVEWVDNDPDKPVEAYLETYTRPMTDAEYEKFLEKMVARYSYSLFSWRKFRYENKKEA